MRLHVQALDNMIGIILFYVSHGRGFSSPFSCITKREPLRLSFCDMVEMVGVEPTSKNISEELSPSAVSALSFAESAVTLTHYGTAIL